jgi:hypothetical protein
MKPILLFGGEVYGNGGWLDFKGEFYTKVDALKAAVGLRWWHIVDTATAKIDCGSSGEPEALLLDAAGVVGRLLDHTITRTQAINAILISVRRESVDMDRVSKRNGELVEEVKRLKAELAAATDSDGGEA